MEGGQWPGLVEDLVGIHHCSNSLCCNSVLNNIMYNGEV